MFVSAALVKENVAKVRELRRIVLSLIILNLFYGGLQTTGSVRKRQQKSLNIWVRAAVGRGEKDTKENFFYVT